LLNLWFECLGAPFAHRTANATSRQFYANGGCKCLMNEIVFAEWDPTAASDMQALLNVFDTNHKGIYSVCAAGITTTPPDANGE